MEVIHYWYSIHQFDIYTVTDGSFSILITEIIQMINGIEDNILFWLKVKIRKGKGTGTDCIAIPIFVAISLSISARADGKPIIEYRNLFNKLVDIVYGVWQKRCFFWTFFQDFLA